MGRSIIMLSQLDQSNQGELLNSLQNIRNNILDRIESESKSNNMYGARSQSDIEYYQQRIEELQTERAVTQVELRRLDRIITFSEADILAKKQEVQQMITQKEQLIGWQKREDSVYTGQQNSYNQAISAIDTATDLLEKAKSQSFIEEHVDTYLVISEDLQNTLEPQYQQISLALAQIANEKFADHDLLRRSSRLLQNLRGSIMDQKVKLQDSQNGERTRNDQLIAMYDSKIQQMNNDLIKVLMDDHQVLLQAYNVRKMILDQIELSISSAEASLKSINNENDTRESTFKTLIKEYEKEVQIIDDCFAQLQNH